MSKIADAIVKQHSHDRRTEILHNPNWVIKILYERRYEGWRTDIERDIYFAAEDLEPDKEKWVTQGEYEAAM